MKTKIMLIIGMLCFATFPLVSAHEIQFNKTNEELNMNI